jgi:hypothetical protein
MDNDNTQSNDEHLFNTTDCTGNKVVLKAGTFIYKISTVHSEVTSELIKSIIESAHIIIKDEIPDRYDCYKIIKHPIEAKNSLICIIVVVETNSSEYNEVVTAFLTRKIPNKSSSGDILYEVGTKS